jgi:PIN like domain
MSLKSIFPEWYGHDDDTVKKIVTDGSICFDANALLDLYRVNKDQREEILVVLKSVSDRIFIPYQAAWEFHNNRLSVVRGNHDVYNSVLKSCFELVQEKLDKLGDKELREEIKELFNASSESFKKVVATFGKKVARLRDEHTVSFQDMLDDDPVLNALEELLTESSIGQRPEPDVLEERRLTALERGERGIPPGFKDSDKADPTGDYLIWCELLDHAESSGRPLLFVTNDKKEDWYRSQMSGKSLGPRPELIVEMRERSPETLYHQADLGSFLFYAREYLGLSVEDETITTVENIESDVPPRPRAPVVTYDDSRIAGVDSATLARAYPNLLGPGSPALQGLGTFQPPPSVVSMTNSIVAQANEALSRQHRELAESIRRATENFMPRVDITSITAGLGALGQLNPSITAGLGALGQLNPSITAGLGALGQLNPSITAGLGALGSAYASPMGTPGDADAVQRLLNPSRAGGVSGSVTPSTAAAENKDETSGKPKRAKKTPPTKSPAKKAAKKSLPTKSSNTDDA